jgi:hypothetical protein
VGDESSGRLVPPLFASTDSAAEIYRTVRDLEAHAEAVDVENGEWRGSDSLGKPIVLRVDGDEVRVEAGVGSSPEVLAEWLRSSPFLKRLRDEDWLRRASLADLVAAFDLEDRAWQEQRPLSRFRRWLARVGKSASHDRASESGRPDR